MSSFAKSTGEEEVNGKLVGVASAAAFAAPQVAAPLAYSAAPAAQIATPAALISSSNSTTNTSAAALFSSATLEDLLSKSVA